jgi:putative ABC transport system permease protein
VEFARTGKRQLRIAGIYDNSGLMGTLGSFVITLSEYDANFTTQLDGVVLATTAPGVSQAQAKAAAATIAKQFPNVKLQDQAQFRKTQSDQINQLLGLVIALLFMSVIIAVAGISNTLYLSVYERTREIGLLRAVGLSRRQTKRMIRWEAILIAVFGALLGTAIGSFFGWAMVRALNDQGITVFSVPASQLVIYVVLAGIFGVIAAFFPALRASRMDVLRAIASE